MRFNARLRPAITRLLVAFEAPHYSRIWLANTFNSSSRWIGRLAVGWLVLNLTNSPLWVGLVAGAEGVGQLAFTVVGGVLVDRLDRRVALVVDYSLYILVFLGLGLLVLTGRIAAWHLLAASALLGALAALMFSATNVVVYQIVGRERLVNATTAQQFSFNAAHIVGSALGGGIIAARGVGPAFLAAAAIGAGAVILALSIRGSFRSSVPPSAFWAAVAEGFKYIWTHPSLRQLLALSAFMEGFGFSHYVLVPVMARDVLKVGAAGLGALSTAAGVGALAGTPFMAMFSANRDKSRLLQIAAASAGLLLALFALSPWYPLSLVLSALSGIAFVCYDVLMQTLIQLLSGDEVRGRVTGMFGLTYGLNLLGGFVAGAVAAAAGAPAAMVAGGGVIVAAALGLLRSARRIRAEEYVIHDT